MTPPERKQLLWLLCEFSTKVERAAEHRDVPAFIAFLDRELARLLMERNRIS
jgi:hypothetical protein